MSNWRVLPCPECGKRSWGFVWGKYIFNQRVACSVCNKEFSIMQLEYLCDLEHAEEFLEQAKQGLKRSSAAKMQVVYQSGYSLDEVDAQLNQEQPLAFYVWRALRFYVKLERIFKKK